MNPCTFRRFVALGDSTTVGIGDADPAGGGPRGWADRLAEALAREAPDLRYANLGVRGKLMHQIRSEQLAPALALRPDLATVAGGFNDLLRRRFDVDATAAELEATLAALRATGATVATMTWPDLSGCIPLARLIRARVEAFDAAVRDAASRTGTIVVDVAALPGADDASLWCDDRMHLNSAGHAVVAGAFAEALGVGGAGGAWAPGEAGGAAQGGSAEATARTAAPSPSALIATELRWTARHVLPWMHRRLRGRSSGDGLPPKRPALTPVER